eukprot:gene3574-biopygen5271
MVLLTQFSLMTGIAERLAQRDLVQEQQRLPTLFPDAAMSRRDKAAAALHGRLVKKVFDDPLSGQARVFWGRVHFRGAQMRPDYFLVVYEDGDFQAATVTAVYNMMLREESSPAVASAAKARTCFVPASISTQDLLLLFSSADLSRVANISYPGSIPQQLQLQTQQLGVQLKPALTASAASATVIVSAQQASLASALRVSAEQLQPAFVAAYQPGFHLSHQVEIFLCSKSRREQGGLWVGKDGGHPFGHRTYQVQQACFSLYHMLLAVVTASQVVVLAMAASGVEMASQATAYATLLAKLDRQHHCCLLALQPRISTIPGLVQAAAAVESAELLALRQQHAAEMQRLQPERQRLRQQLLVKADRLDAELSNVAGLVAQVDQLRLQQQFSE